MSDFDLNGLAEQLNSSLGSSDSAPVPSSQPSVSDTPVTSEVPASSSVETASTPQDDIVEVTFPDGTKEAIKRSDLPNAVLRQKDYTRKTQELAQFRQRYQEFEQNAPRIRAELEFAEQMRQATQDPEALFKYVVEQIGPQKAIQLFSGQIQQNPGAYDPNDIPTYQEADKLIETKLSTYEKRLQEQEQRFTQQLEQRVAQERQALEFERQKNEYQNKFDSLITESFSTHPELRAIDLAEDIMRFRVATKIENFVKHNGYEPSFEQAATWLKDAVKEQVTKLETQFNAKRVNSPLNNSIEPAGGNRPVGVNTQAKSYYDPKTGQVDTDAQLRDLAARISQAGRL